MPTTLTTQQKMPYLLPSTLSDPPGEKGQLCEDAVHRLQFSIQHIHPTAWACWVYTPPSESGSWTFWLWDPSPIGNTTSSTTSIQALPRAVCSVHFCLHCWLMNGVQTKTPITSSNLLQLWVSLGTMMSQHTWRRWTSLQNGADTTVYSISQWR